MKNKSRLIYLLQEIAIVVVGVLIAVSINNYKERIDNEEYIGKTLLAIEKETESSAAAVDSVLNKHYALLDSLATYIDDKEQPLGDMVARFGGVQFPVIKNISLRFFIANKAELMDYEVIAQLLEMEDFTRVLQNKMDRMADFAYEQINDRSEETKLKFAYLLSDVIDSEETLLEAYAAFLNDNASYLQGRAEE